MRSVPKRDRVGFITSRMITYGIFLLFTISTLFPLVWLFYSSFKSKGEYLLSQIALPRQWTIQNYIGAIKLGKLGLYMVNSILYTSFSTGLVLLFSIMVSYAFAKMPYKKTNALFATFFTLGLLISEQALLIPLFLFLRAIRLTDTHIGIILVYVAVNLPLAIFLGTEFVRGIPDSLIESAYIDGAGNWKVFFRIIFPICKPVLVTIGIITALACWNEFIFVFILTSSYTTRSLPVGIFSFSGETATEYGMQFAALVIGTVPILLVYSIFNRRITEGVVSGAIKE